MPDHSKSDRPDKSESETSENDSHESRLARWSHRKLAAYRYESSDFGDDENGAAGVADHRGMATTPDAKIKMERADELKSVPDDLVGIDIAALQPDYDFSRFLKDDVPEFLTRKALRHMWASDPVLANLDGLNEYDEDYRDAAMGVELMKGAFQRTLAAARDKGTVPSSAPDALANDTLENSRAENSGLENGNCEKENQGQKDHDYHPDHTDNQDHKNHKDCNNEIDNQCKANKRTERITRTRGDKAQEKHASPHIGNVEDKKETVGDRELEGEMAGLDLKSLDLKKSCRDQEKTLPDHQEHESEAALQTLARRGWLKLR